LVNTAPLTADVLNLLGPDIDAKIASLPVVRYTPQTLTFPQKGLALANIGSAQYNLINGKLVESHAANSATFAIKTLAGVDPSPNDPVHTIFPDGSVFTLTYPVAIVIPQGSTFGTGLTGQSAPCRLWFAVVPMGGTLRIVVRRCNDTGIIAGFDPRGILNAIPINYVGPELLTAMNSSVANFSNADFITARPYRIIAFADYETGGLVNGNWVNSPTRIVLVGANTPLPGTTLQDRTNYGSQVYTNSGGWQATNTLVDISISSPLHGVRVRFDADTLLVCSVSNEYGYTQLARDGTLIGNQTFCYGWAASVVHGFALATTVLDFPFKTAMRYAVYFRIQVNGGNGFYFPHGGSSISAAEIMV
jgi:hypothetical protein